MSTKYRPDIDGLRGVAVAAVVLYHAFPDAVPGGFVGVDLFFVISGFLITGIITDALRAGTFSFRDFYARRVRRIFPALMLVLLATCVAGVFVLAPDDLRDLGSHLMAGAGLSSNVIFWKQAGYFDVASEAKPLLHLWSLGVEEQFYLVWPLLLFASRSRGWRVLILVVGACSLAVCLVQTPTRHAAAAFYLPSTRAWEFMIGAALAQRVRLPAAVATGASWIGLALLVGSVFLLDRTLPYPGWRAISPSVGTGLVIAAGPDRICNRLLAWRPLVGVGLISYPLYLWHWPLLALCRIANDFEIAAAVRGLVIAGSVVLAWLTYRFVEQPLRRGPRQRTKTIALLVTGGLVVVLGAVAYEGLAAAADEQLTSFTDAEAKLEERHAPRPCDADARIVGRARDMCTQAGNVRGGPLIVIWGDSHAKAWQAVLLDLAAEQHAGVYLFVHPGCPAILGVHRTDGIGNAGFCDHTGYGEDIVESIRALRPQVVVLVSRWSLYANGLRVGGRLAAATHFVTASRDGLATEASSRAALAEQLPRTVDELAAISRVVVFKSPPVLHTISRRPPLKRVPGLEPTLEAHRAAEAVTDAILDKLATHPRVQVFDPASFLCTARCSAFLDGVPFYIDDNHASAQGSFKLRDKIAPYMSAVMKP